MAPKYVYIVAGPNGAGKTTFATKFLPKYAHCPNFVNADLIAKGLSPFSPDMAAMKAGRLVLGQVRAFAEKRVDFGFETTLSGRSYLPLLRRIKQMGYHLRLFFLWVPTVQLSLARIKIRVKEGGHDVPEEDVKRRFRRSIHNLFNLYRPILDSWMFFDNSTSEFNLVVEEFEGKLDIKDDVLFDHITKESGIEL